MKTDRQTDQTAAAASSISGDHPQCWLLLRQICFRKEIGSFDVACNDSRQPRTSELKHSAPPSIHNSVSMPHKPMLL